MPIKDSKMTHPVVHDRSITPLRFYCRSFLQILAQPQPQLSYAARNPPPRVAQHRTAFGAPTIASRRIRCSVTQLAKMLF